MSVVMDNTKNKNQLGIVFVDKDGEILFKRTFNHYARGNNFSGNQE